MSVRTLRLWSGVGSFVLVAGVVFLAVGVALWKPLATAPGLWALGTGILIGAGLVVTAIATSTLAAKTRRK
ncbi:hypothetical protein [Cryobacterium sp. SO1]|uniref:hypothetical protein n=1 Tax=Cryobacterium sp. SO1 TaxID=1897061 RepID=UPI001022BFD7|nr:hypothetical protein [Cryobacterium sp. SO1]RZI35456.1 hypothetical protein BJQ95_02176 [Cryobacterium sp. SO1]